MTCTYSETKRQVIFGYLTQFTAAATIEERNDFINLGSIFVVNEAYVRTWRLISIKMAGQLLWLRKWL